MENEKAYVEIKHTFYFKLKMSLINFFQNEQWAFNFLNDVKAHPKRYFRIKECKPPDESNE
ncbi:MAG: hypothetical protein JJU16_05220 [Alkalibacterium sp.]|nr:hypothetical protein [Alkalibacterium sp.]